MSCFLYLIKLLLYDSGVHNSIIISPFQISPFFWSSYGIEINFLWKQDRQAIRCPGQHWFGCENLARVDLFFITLPLHASSHVWKTDKFQILIGYLRRWCHKLIDSRGAEHFVEAPCLPLWPCSWATSRCFSCFYKAFMNSKYEVFISHDASAQRLSDAATKWRMGLLIWLCFSFIHAPVQWKPSSTTVINLNKSARVSWRREMPWRSLFVIYEALNLFKDSFLIRQPHCFLRFLHANDSTKQRRPYSAGNETNLRAIFSRIWPWGWTDFHCECMCRLWEANWVWKHTGQSHLVRV